MNNEMSSTETDADVDRARVAGVSEEQIDSPIHTTPSEKKIGELRQYCQSYDTMTTARRDIKGLIAEKVDCVHVERTQAEVQAQK